ncbi:phosphotransferase enzyme family protein [Paenibacillus sp. 1P07SE]|uniref:phosphotransferase enzyme family protein n=1 Tax=Paenibacillus sp. 1P07SE TaxID=3132209 RepID=UPI0039A6E8C3
MEQTSLNYGLVHGDLHLGNIVFHDGVPAPIDFGLCGHGYYLYDVAAPMLSMWPKHRWMLLSSYEALRPTGPGAVQALETFFIMIMIENYSHHASNPREAASLKAEQPYALAYLKLFLGGEPFLFEVVEPVKMESD